MRNTTSLLIVVAAIAFIAAGPAMAQANLHDATGAYEGLLDLIRASANQWSGRLRGIAINIFWSLALIQFVWTFGMLIFRQADLGEILAEFVRFIMIIGFFATLLLYSVEWAGAIIKSFMQAGSAAAGSGIGIQPGDMFGLAVTLAKMVGSVSTMNPVAAITAGFGAIIILLCFGFIAVFMGVTLIEAYVIINASVLFMGFGGSQWTREYAITILRGALAIGAKLFVLTLIIGLVMESARTWQVAYRNDDASTWTLIALALACAYMAKSIPDLIASLISGVSPGGGGIIGGMAAAGMAFGAGAMAALHSSGVMSGAGSAIGGVSDLLKGSGGSGPAGSPGMSSSMNGPSGGGSGGAGRSGGLSSRIGGGIGSGLGPEPGPTPSGKPSNSGGSSSAGGTAKSGGGSSAAQMAHMATDAAVRSAGVAMSIAVPGAEGASSVSVGPPPSPPDLSGFDDSMGETPENIIRPAPAEAPEPAVDTMSSLQEALNNRGKP